MPPASVTYHKVTWLTVSVTWAASTNNPGANAAKGQQRKLQSHTSDADGFCVETAQMTPQQLFHMPESSRLIYSLMTARAWLEQPLFVECCGKVARVLGGACVSQKGLTCTSRLTRGSRPHTHNTTIGPIRNTHSKTPYIYMHICIIRSKTRPDRTCHTECMSLTTAKCDIRA